MNFFINMNNKIYIFYQRFCDNIFNPKKTNKQFSFYFLSFVSGLKLKDKYFLLNIVLITGLFIMIPEDFFIAFCEEAFLEEAYCKIAYGEEAFLEDAYCEDTLNYSKEDNVKEDELKDDEVTMEMINKSLWQDEAEQAARDAAAEAAAKWRWYHCRCICRKIRRIKKFLDEVDPEDVLGIGMVVLGQAISFYCGNREPHKPIEWVGWNKAPRGWRT